MHYDYTAVGSLTPDAYRQLNPQGLLPSLVLDDGTVIAQSSAILEYLEETTPQPAILPTDPILRAQARSFGQLITADLHPVNNARIRRYLREQMSQSDESVQGWYEHWVRVSFEALEEMLARRPADWPFCYGDAPGWADLHLVPQMANARRFNCDLDPYRRLCAIDARCQEIKAFQAARPERQPDYPRNGP